MTKKNFNRALFAFAVIAFCIHLYKKNMYDKARENTPPAQTEITK